jgi:hypothetical protein
MKKKTFDEIMTEASSSIIKMFKQVDEEYRSSLAEFIAVQATIQGADTVYEGIGILDVAKRSYEDCCLDEEDGKVIKMVNLN